MCVCICVQRFSNASQNLWCIYVGVFIYMFICMRLNVFVCVYLFQYCQHNTIKRYIYRRILENIRHE